MTTTDFRLGEAVGYMVSVVSVEKSEAFYTQLGFHKLDEGNSLYNWARYSDGYILLLLHENPAQGLCYFSADMKKVIAKLHAEGAPFDHRFTLAKDGFELLVTPNQLGISLVPLNPEHLGNLGPVTAAAGKFCGVITLSKDMETDAKFWQTLGFKIEAGGKGWMGLYDGRMRLSFTKRESCPHYFEGPGLTYFSRDQTQALTSLSSKGFQFHETPNFGETGPIRHAIALSPEGQTFFLFTEAFDFEAPKTGLPN